MDRPYIECISLSKEYKGKKRIVHALKDVTFSAGKGEFVLLKGRSGAGKSTLLNLIGGLIKPTHGTVRIEDDIITTLDNNTLSGLLLNKTGIIFQSLNLLPTYSVFENIEVALAPKGFSADEIRDLAAPYLEQFGLSDKINMFPEELSLGQQQKVAIIRTLVKKPELILADEPTASVDDETAGEILKHLRDLKNKQNVTILLATHGIVPDTFADRVVTLENGILVH
ncbi:MAG: ABC transporter ATP-binding protein [Chloroflexota bacterium]